jgi:hypothetical protein
MCAILKAIVTRVAQERVKCVLPTRLSVLGHKIFRSISDIVKGLDKLEFS